MTERSSHRLESELAAIRVWEPHVKALLHFDEQGARQRAAAAKTGPLAGWSVAVKDIVDWAGFPTRCNATFMPTTPAAKNAAFLDALLDKGAFVMAKAHTTTFAYRDPTVTHNPWKLGHTPGGSSSGSAAAVAVGMVRLAIGTQTVASINRPASFCGVVGFKPSYGTFDKTGVYPLADSADTMGFFTTDAKDAQTAFAALTGRKEAPLRHMRVGYITHMRCEPPGADMAEALESSAKRLKREGHDVRPVKLPDICTEAYPNHWTLVAAECAKAHTPWFDRHSAAYPPHLREMVERGRTIKPEQIKQIQMHRDRTSAAIDMMFDDFDLLLTPSAPDGAPQGIESTGDPRMSLVNAYTGIPSLTLPAGLSTQRLPLGIQLMTRRGRDAALLAAGLAVESLLNFDLKPEPPK